MATGFRKFDKRTLDLSDPFDREFWTDHLDATMKRGLAEMRKAIHSLEVAQRLFRSLGVDAQAHASFVSRALSCLTTTSPNEAEDAG